MDNFFRSLFICILSFSIAMLAGCGKTVSPSNNITEPTKQEIPVSAEESPTSPAQVSQSYNTVTPEFDYEPGSMGAYVKAAFTDKVDPEILDSLEMTLPEDVSRISVSACQIDFVRNGMQVGGILIVSIPDEMINKACQTKDGFQEMADCLAKQVMPDLYPEMTHLNGGGAGIKGEYARFFVEANDRSTQYKHCIYLGQQYCYDLWIDQAWWGDTGYGVQDTLSSDDIKPELNSIEFSWTN